MKPTPGLTDSESFLGYIFRQEELYSIANLFREVLDLCKHFLSSNSVTGEIYETHDSDWNEFLYSIITPSFSQNLGFIDDCFATII